MGTHMNGHVCAEYDNEHGVNIQYLLFSVSLHIGFCFRSENETKIGRRCLVTCKYSAITATSDVQRAMRPCLCHMLCLITWKLSFPEATAA